MDRYQLNASLVSVTAAHRPSSPTRSRYSGLLDNSGQITRQHEINQAVQEAIEKLEQFWASRHERLATLRRLTNPPVHKIVTRRRADIIHVAKPDYLRLPEANAGPVSHEIFRTRLVRAHDQKCKRAVLRTQLLHCEEPQQIYRVIGVALKFPEVAEALSQCSAPLIRALYRCRRNVSDMQVLRTLVAIIGRFRLNHVVVHDHLYQVALKFAARARSLEHMKKLLRACHEREIPLTSNTIRSIMAKFSIGHRGLGEIRNGRWRRSELLQVLLGFDDCNHLPREAQYHLGTFVDRDEWQSMHGWVACLARCRDTKSVWREWELWKEHPARRRPKRLNCAGDLNTRTRGDSWFVVQMVYAGGIDEAWTMLRETGMSFYDFPPYARSQLLSVPECVREVQDGKMRGQMLWNLDKRLRLIEEALGVKWIASTTEDDAQGEHVAIMDQEEMLERIGDPEWELEPDYGYPYEDSVAQSADVQLRDAAETGPVETI